MYDQNPKKPSPPDDIDDYLSRYTRKRVREEAQKQGVDPDLAERQFGAESSYRPEVIKGQRRSSAGAIGAGQLMPGTAKDLGVDPYHIDENISGSVRYMKQQLDAFGGDPAKAAAAYNWGPGNVKKYGLSNAPAETQNYVKNVAGQQKDDVDEFLSRWKEPSAPRVSPFDETEDQAKARRAGMTSAQRKEDRRQTIGAMQNELVKSSRIMQPPTPPSGKATAGVFGQSRKGQAELKKAFRVDPSSGIQVFEDAGINRVNQRAAMPATPESIKRRKAVEAERARFQQRSLLGRAAETAATQFALNSPEWLTPEAQQDINTRALALGLEPAKRDEWIYKPGTQLARSAARTAASGIQGTAELANLFGRLSPGEAQALLDAADTALGAPKGYSAQKAKELLASARELPGKAEQVTPLADPTDESWLGAKIPQAFGSAAVFGPLGQAGQALRIPGAVVSGMTGAAIGAGQQNEAARKAGVSQERQDLATLLGALSGSTEALGFERLMGGTGAVPAPVKEVVKDAVQEYGQQYLDDINAKYVGGYDPNASMNPLSRDKVEAAALGGIVSGTMSAPSVIANRAANARNIQQIQAERAPMPGIAPSVPAGTQTQITRLTPEAARAASQPVAPSVTPDIANAPTTPLTEPIATPIPSEAIPAPSQPNAPLFPAAQQQAQPDLTKMSAFDRLAAMQAQRQGIDQRSVEQRLNEGYAQAAGLVEGAGRIWDTDRGAAEQMVETADANLRSALKDVRNSQAYQQELSAVAQGGQPGVYMNAVSAINDRLAEVDRLRKLDATREKESTRQVKEVQASQKAAAKEPVASLDDLRMQAEGFKQQAAEAERAGNLEAAATAYESARDVLRLANTQNAKRADAQTLAALRQDINLQNSRLQQAKQRMRNEARQANKPTAGIPQPRRQAAQQPPPLMRSGAIVNPEGGIPAQTPVSEQYAELLQTGEPEQDWKYYQEGIANKRAAVEETRAKLQKGSKLVTPDILRQQEEDLASYIQEAEAFAAQHPELVTQQASRPQSQQLRQDTGGLDQAEDEDMAALRRAQERSERENPREYGERTRPGEPAGISFSDYSVLQARNARAEQALYDSAPGSPRFRNAEAAIRQDAQQVGIAPRHVDAMVAYALNYHSEKAFWAERGLDLDKIQNPVEAAEAYIETVREEIRNETARLSGNERTEIEREVAAIDEVFNDPDMVELLDRAADGDQDAASDFKQLGVDYYGLKPETASELVRSREEGRQQSAARPSRTGQATAPSQAEGASTRSNTRQAARQLSADERRLVQTRPVEVFDQDFDDYTRKVESLYAQAVRGEVAIDPKRLYDPAKWVGLTPEQIEERRKAGEGAGLLAKIHGERAKRVEDGRLPARENLEQIEKYKGYSDEQLKALGKQEREGRKTRLETLENAVRVTLEKNPRGAKPEWMAEVRALDERLKGLRQPAEAKPAPTGRVIQHSQFGEVRESADQSGVAKGKLRVVDSEGAEHVIQNPRTAGNRSAAFAKSEKAEADRLAQHRADLMAKAKAYDERQKVRIQDVTPADYAPGESTSESRSVGLDEYNVTPDEQRLKSSIAEGEMLLRGKLSPEKRVQIQRSVDNTKQKLAELRAENDAKYSRPSPVQSAMEIERDVPDVLSERRARQKASKKGDDVDALLAAGTITPEQAAKMRRKPKISERREAPGAMPERYTGRQLFENARVEFRPARNRPATLIANDWGGAMMNRLLSDTFGESTTDANFTVAADDMQTLRDRLAEARDSGIYDEAQTANMDALLGQIDAAIKDAKANNQDVAFVTRKAGEPISQTKIKVRHETAHVSQSRVTPDMFALTERGWLGRQPEAAAVRAELERRGYPPETHAHESAVFVASGDFDAFGMNLDQATKFLSSYFKAVIQKHGRRALDRFGAIDPRLQPALERARNEKTEAGQARIERRISSEASGARRAGTAGAEVSRSNAGVLAGRREESAGVPEGTSRKPRTRADVENSPEFKRLAGLLGSAGMARRMITSSDKSVMDGLERHAKSIADLLESGSSLTHSDGTLNIPSSVVSHVLKVSENPEILRAVVRSLPVDVVNFFRRQQLAPQHLLRDKAMLENVLTADSKSPISLPVSIAAPLLRSVAGTATELALTTRSALELNSAVVTGVDNTVPDAHKSKRITDNPNFSRWFGDSVVTEDGKPGGKPLVVYHGTGKYGDFDAFSDEKTGSVGFYFTRNPEHAGRFAVDNANIRPVYLNISKPATADAYKAADRNARGGNPRRQIIEELKSQGYDGIIRPGEIIAFSPTQIKSAFNRGTFDPQSPKISERKEAGFSFGRLENEPEGQIAAAGLGALQNIKIPRTQKNRQFPLPSHWDEGKWTADAILRAGVESLPKDARERYDDPKATAADKRQILSQHSTLTNDEVDKIADILTRVQDATVNGDGGALYDAVGEFNEILGKVAIRNKSLARRVGRNLIDSGALSRALMASSEISAVLRQGAILTLPPTQWGKAAKAGVRMFEALIPERILGKEIAAARYRDIVKEINLHPDAETAKDAGLFLSTDLSTGLRKSEEDFISRWAGKIPIVAASERAYKTYLDSLRMDTFAKYKRVIDKNTNLDEFQKRKAYKAAAEWINTVAGRGSVNQSVDQAFNAFSLVMFAPRYAISRFQVLNPYAYAKNATTAEGRTVLKQQMGDALQYGGMVALTMALAHAAGASVGFDPDDPDFLKIRFGNTRYDVLAGLQQPMRLIYRLSKDVYRRTRGQKSERGENALDILGKFARSKLAPIPSAVVDFFKGRDFIGRPFEAKRAVIERVTPLFWKDFVEAAQREGVQGGIKMLPGALGVGVQDYEKKTGTTSVGKGKFGDELKRFGLEYDYVRPKEGEPPAIHKKRADRVEGWMNSYGEKLVSHPLYNLLTAEQKQKAIENLRDRVGKQMNLVRPNERTLEPQEVIKAVRKAATRKPRRGSEQLWEPEN